MSIGIGFKAYAPNYGYQNNRTGLNVKQVGFKGTQEDVKRYKDYVQKMINVAHLPEDSDIVDDLDYDFNSFYNQAMKRDPITATRETWLAGEKLEKAGFPENNWARKHFKEWGEIAVKACQVRGITMEQLQKGYNGNKKF